MNEYEYELLDAVLEAFGRAGSLTRLQALELFGDDEQMALEMVQVLSANGLLTEPLKHGTEQLPGKLVLSAKAGPFIKEGGFSARYHTAHQKPAETGGGTLAKLQQQNMRLQNDKLAKGAELKDLQKKVDSLRSRQFIWLLLIVLALAAGFFIGHVVDPRIIYLNAKVSKHGNKSQLP